MKSKRPRKNKEDREKLNVLDSNSGSGHLRTAPRKFSAISFSRPHNAALFFLYKKIFPSFPPPHISLPAATLDVKTSSLLPSHIPFHSLFPSRACYIHLEGGGEGRGNKKEILPPSGPLSEIQFCVPPSPPLPFLLLRPRDP